MNIICEVDNINEGEFVCQNCARTLMEDKDVDFDNYHTVVGICRVCGKDKIPVVQASNKKLELGFFMSRVGKVFVVNSNGKLWYLDYG